MFCGDPFAEGRGGFYFDPAVFKFTLGVVGKGGGVPVVGGELGHGAREESGLDEDLEAVADAEDELAVVDELSEGGFEVVNELVGEDFTGGDVVAVGEAAGKGEDLVIGEAGGVLEEGVDVEGVDGNIFSTAAGEGEGVGEFAVAVGAGGAKEEDARGHGRFLVWVYGEGIIEGGRGMGEE